MFSRTPTNPLKSIIFTDGQVKSFSRGGDVAELEFVDYEGSPVKVRFLGVESVECPHDPANSEIMQTSFSFRSGAWCVHFKDDDGTALITIEYREAVVEVG